MGEPFLLDSGMEWLIIRVSSNCELLEAILISKMKRADPASASALSSPLF